MEGGFAMTAHVQQASMLTGRSMTFMAVIGLHVAVIGGLMTMKMIPDVGDKLPPALQWIIDPPLPPPDDPLPKPNIVEAHNAVPMPTVIFNPPDIVIQAFEVVEVQNASQTTTAASDTGTVVESASGPGAVIAPPARVATALQYRITRPTDEYYPDTSKVIQEQGVAIVRVCVDAAGRMSGAPLVETSSGFKRLDQAALRWARESLSFTPATENGVGVPACKGFRVNFNLH
jgi:TonB family protein